MKGTSRARTNARTRFTSADAENNIADSRLADAVANLLEQERFVVPGKFLEPTGMIDRNHEQSILQAHRLGVGRNVLADNLGPVKENL